MQTLEEYIDTLQSQGRYTFSRRDVSSVWHRGSKSFLAAAERLKKKGRLVSPKRGFFLIIRPEDRAFGAPPPDQWIAPLMKYVGSDYRVSLLRAAAFHGSSHQAAMVFQVIAPKQMKPIEVGRQRIHFTYQAPKLFKQVNRSEWLADLKSETGVARIAGVELTLLDCARYFHDAAGMNGAAQIVFDLGSKANAKKLTAIAPAYENASVRRLGYLLEKYGHARQATALARFAAQAKSNKPLDPSAKTFALSGQQRKRAIDEKWRLVLNVPVEIDS